MTDAELGASWPELGALVGELRRQGHGELANRLIDSVQYASTSGEIYNGVGAALMQNKALRRSLGPGGSAAYGMPRPMRWLMRWWRRI